MADKKQKADKQRKEGNQCIGLGVGVGTLGGTAAAMGAVCPVCFFVAPALVAAGLYQRNKASKDESNTDHSLEKEA